MIAKLIYHRYAQMFKKLNRNVVMIDGKNVFDSYYHSQGLPRFKLEKTIEAILIQHS